MTKTQAIEQVCKNAEDRGLILSSTEIAYRASLLLEDEAKIQRRRNEYNVLSSKNVGSLNMRPITTLNALTQPVLRELVCSSAAEFLGEEFWLSLSSTAERLAAKRTFDKLRDRITRGMA